MGVITKYLVDGQGRYLGAFTASILEDGTVLGPTDLPAGIYVNQAPCDGRQKWANDTWQPLERRLVITDRLTVLDGILPRSVEDLYAATGAPMFGAQLAAKTEKQALRAELAGL